MLAHVLADDHPDTPARLHTALAGLRADPRPNMRWISPAPAPANALLRVHDAMHLERLEALRGTCSQISAVTAVCPESVKAIELAAGSGIAAVDALFADEARRAFCLTRPPGHHAKRSRMMGACFINNIAVAAAHARAQHGAARVMIVDWGVHHGNGTES
ncbi:MAG TPA: histone deacetylase, partial [Nannocystis exedens]|nr:histone deacetylase [Nannocystis exedens]